MRDRASRRALRLASMLVAAGLAMSFAPQALAADTDSTGMKLTSAEGKALAERVQTDVYGDDAQDAATGSSDTSSDDSASDGSASDGSSTDAASKITTTRTSKVEGVRGYGTTIPVGNKKGDYFTLHSLGHVSRTAADGTEQWSRDSASLYSDWGVKFLRAWDTEFYPPRIVMGFNAVGPFTANSGQGYDTGDLTGDGVPDVVFSANLGFSPAVGVDLPNSTLTRGTIVTVLDGATGKTLYSKVYAYASLVKVVDGALLVGDAPSLNGTTTGSAKLTSTRFSYEDGALTPSSTWSYDTGTTAYSNWAAVQDLGDGRAAVSWDVEKSDTNGSEGHTVVVDMNDGSVVWKADSSLYSRHLGLDTGRDQLVAVEQSDYTDGVRYEVVAYDLDNGRRTTLSSRVNVLPTAFTVGDLTSDTGDEYVVSESSLTDDLFVNASTIRVLSGDDPETALWQSTTKRGADNGADGPSTWKLEVTGNKLVAAGEDDTDLGKAENAGGRYATLSVFTAKGKVAWQTKGATASPVFADVYKDTGGKHIRVVDTDQNVRTYGLTDGTQEQLTPLQGDIAYAQTLDVDGDKKDDLVEGGQSNGIWAYKGTSLVDGKPQVLWKATLPGAVHAIETADVTGDKTPEIVVAADSAVVVLDSATGATLATIDGGGQYVRSVVLGDVDGNGKADILVPTDSLHVYKGNGKALWSYSAPASAGDVLFGDPSVSGGKVYTQYTSADALDLDTPVNKALQLDGATGAVGWDAAPEVPAGALSGIRGGYLDNATYTSTSIPYADGNAVVYTWLVDEQIRNTNVVGTENYVEIRDGRTGKVVHQQTTGGLWTHSNYFDVNGSLAEAGTASVYGFGADGADTRVIFTPTTHNAGLVTGPGGQQVGITGSEGGIYLWDKSELLGDDAYPAYLGKTATEGGARNYTTGDFDGDGVDEIVTLNFDDRGTNEMAESLGGGYLIANSSIHEVSTYKLS
ncbi:FG-GAP-like repeat-containing protein [Streptomyces mangrovisoli]|uniref:VCBS repeat-containing protein n=1 Tax=Streptomyces mangrovisoli TaxID=1428628 RepID=A0A1J4P4N1_9ACTN|nr:FG-GAP-like repeat-containing protein [Streptomyces mangrovisoli]OIJ68429.1 hypothetical protein WN71_008395 [Streptomyces mangrovisoli]